MEEHRNIAIAVPCVGEEEWLATKDSFQSGWLTQGPKVAEFEQAFAKHHGVAHAIATSSCTTGLHLSLRALGIEHGDEVIVPAFTWVATANVVLQCGATPIFVDVDPKTYNIDPAQVAAAVSSRTKAIIPVHLFGYCADMVSIRSALPSHVKVIEDAACAVGASYQGQHAGALGDCGVFSFHPRKTVTTGEGGMVTTNDDALASLLQQLRNHGAAISEEQRHHGPKPYILPDFQVFGFNYRMTDLQGAVGTVQLSKLNSLLEERRYWAKYYNQHLTTLPWLHLPKEPEDGKHSWQAFVCRIDPSIAPLKRNVLMEELQRRGISTRPGTHSVPHLSCYRNRYNFNESDFPAAFSCEQQTIALPFHNRMDEDDFNYVIQSLHELADSGVLV